MQLYYFTAFPKTVAGSSACVRGQARRALVALDVSGGSGTCQTDSYCFMSTQGQPPRYGPTRERIADKAECTLNLLEGAGGSRECGGGHEMRL